ncbi:MAG TPA: DUF4936 family protein [Casimicrobiaceae bacterium]|nr:DUF4936 family protein [Casimicrobiaceae bacterium]
MSAEPVSYYIYYRVEQTRAEAARRAIKLLFGALEQRTGVAGRLLRRQDEPLMWMEIYDGVRDPSGFETAMAAMLADHDFVPMLAPGSLRHVERFVAASLS